MSPLSKITWSIVVAVVAVAAVISQFVKVREADFNHLSYTTNSGELGGDVLVGQTFTAQKDDLSGIGIMFATYSNRNNTEPISFHLRSSTRDQEDLRVATVHPSALGDNQFYEFEFEPIPNSKGEDYFFFVTSFTSGPGNAVAVDLDTRDPYHLGSAYVVRGVEGDVTDPDILDLSGKQTMDVSFRTLYTVTLREYVTHTLINSARTFIATWDQNRGLYERWGKGLAAALMFLGVVFMVQQKPYAYLVERFGKEKITMISLLVLFIVGLLLRLDYAVQMPLTNDEGNYLYDAQALRRGVLAGGDGYVKAPLFVLWIAFWQVIAGDTVLAGRLSSVVAGALTMFPLYFLARDLWTSKVVTRTWLPSYLVDDKESKIKKDAGWGRRVGLVTAAAWALFGAAIIFNIYIHTQPIALFFGVAGLSTLLLAHRGTTPHLTFIPKGSAPSVTGWFVLAGVLLGLGVASRKSILALGLVPLLLILLESKSWKNGTKHLIAVGSGFLLVLVLFLGSAYFLYGEAGVWEAIGYNSAEDGINTEEDPDLVRAYSLRGMTPFFRESMPLILLAIIGFGVMGEQTIRSYLRWLKQVPSRSSQIFLDIVVPKLGWIPAWLIFLWAFDFFFEYEGEVFWQFGIEELWWLFGGILLLMTLLPRSKEEAIAWPKEEEQDIIKSQQPGITGTRQQTVDIEAKEALARGPIYHIIAWLFVPLWMGGLVFFYTNWIKFHANYISEFIPPLILLSGFGTVALFHQLRGRVFWFKDRPWLELLRRVTVGGIIAVIIWAITVSNYITYTFEHTGTFDLGSIQEAADWAKENIPLDTPIFTGAAAIPYLSGHGVTLDIAHPRWYAYEFTRKDTKRLNTFLPPAEEMVQAFRDSDWVLLERQTGFSFLMEYTEIEKSLLEGDFVVVEEIENLGNPLKFYRRVRN